MPLSAMLDSGMSYGRSETAPQDAELRKDGPEEVKKFGYLSEKNLGKL